MKDFKKFEFGMWHIYAFESDGSQDSFIAKDLVPITEDEANEIRKLPFSEEYRNKIEAGRKALGGRNSSRYPPKEFKEAIGHICVNSSHLEVTIRTIIWQIGSVNQEIGMAFTGNMRPGELLQILKTLVELRASYLSPKTNEICARITSLFQERAKYVHRIWTVGQNHSPIVTKYFIERSPGRADPFEVSLDKMYDLAEEFIMVEGRFLQKFYCLGWKTRRNRLHIEATHFSLD